MIMSPATTSSTHSSVSGCIISPAERLSLKSPNADTSNHDHCGEAFFSAAISEFSDQCRTALVLSMFGTQISVGRGLVWHNAYDPNFVLLKDAWHPLDLSLTSDFEASSAVPLVDTKDTGQITHRLYIDQVRYELLTNFESTVQLAQCLRDAVAGHQGAYKSVSLLHSDVSLANVVIADGCRGLLIDWDRASARKSADRTGIHPFMSIKLLSTPFTSTVVHTVEDDLESFIYVALWMGVRFAANGTTPHQRDTFMNALYDSSALEKQSLVNQGAAAITLLKLKSKPLSGILSGLMAFLNEVSPRVREVWFECELFAITSYRATLKHWDAEQVDAELAKLNEENDRRLRIKPMDHDWVLKIFDLLIEGLEWPKGDAAVRQVDLCGGR